MVVILLLLFLCSSAFADVRETGIIVDPEMAKSVGDGLRGFTPREMREIRQLAGRALVQARTWLRQPNAREYFQKHYKLEPVKLLDETGMTVKVMSLTHRGDDRGAEYIEETRTMGLNVREFYVAIRGQWQDQWVPLLGAKIVHELVHAAAIDSGRHWEPKAGEPDEGTVAERELGVHRPKAPEWMLGLRDLLMDFPPLTD